MTGGIIFRDAVNDSSGLCSPVNRRYDRLRRLNGYDDRTLHSDHSRGSRLNALL